LQHERVIVASRAVSSSTTQLLTAATVKADPNSQNQMRLKAAGKAVTNATEQLVKAAEEAMKLHDTSAMTNQMVKPTATGATGAKILELEAQMNILKMEKELERARAKLAAVRKGRYQGDSTAETEVKPPLAINRATKMFERPGLRNNSTPKDPQL
jgi:talin